MDEVINLSRGRGGKVAWSSDSGSDTDADAGGVMQSDAVTVEAAVPSRSPAAAPKDDAPECSAFECNICYDVAESPVVTLCGHLYCWPCLYR